MEYLLTKSTFIRGCQCFKSLYLNRYHRDLKSPISIQQQQVFDRGHSVGKVAQGLFPDGIDLQKKNQFDFDTSISEVKKLFSEKNTVIYEAPFFYDDVLAVVDILVADNGERKVYEVKSSTSISETYLLDAALQYWVMKNSGTEPVDFYIVYLNNNYIYQGELDLNQLFVIESVLERILLLQDVVFLKVQECKRVLTDAQVPNIGIGEHCKAPYRCDFHEHC